GGRRYIVSDTDLDEAAALWMLPLSVRPPPQRAHRDASALGDRRIALTGRYSLGQKLADEGRIVAPDPPARTACGLSHPRKLGGTPVPDQMGSTGQLRPVPLRAKCRVDVSKSPSTSGAGLPSRRRR